MYHFDNTKYTKGLYNYFMWHHANYSDTIHTL